jgi:ABC-type nitrate/sulfonate/bicarbonate transport system permease component
MHEMSRRTRQLAVVLRLLSLALVLGIWQWYGSMPEHVATPPPTKVFPALWDALLHEDLLGRTWGTLLEVVVGLAISLAFGIIVGFAIALFPWAKDTLDPLVDAAYAMPTIMLIPIIGVYTGLGFRGRIFIVFLYVALVIVVSTSVGVREIDEKLLETAHAFGLRGFSLFRKVMFPAALSHIAAGTAIGVSRAVRGAVAAELLLITANLGGFIIEMQAKFNNRALIAGILWTLFIGYALYEGALWLERRLTPWRATTN